MKPLISVADYRILHEQASRPFDRRILERLGRKATITPENELPKKAVRLNSIVYLWHSLLRRIVKIRLVAPALSDLASRNVSALSPLGQAVFGYSENDRLKVNIGGISKELMIVRVLNK